MATGVLGATYNLLVASYRAKPGNHSAAALSASCDPRTAKRAWERGWPSLQYRAISDMVAEEMAAARKLLTDHIGRERLRILNDSKELTLEEERKLAVDQRVREGRMAQAARDNALGLMGILTNLLRSSIELSRRVGEKLAEGKLETTTEVAAAVRLLARELPRAVLAANEAGKTALEIERIRLGLPSAIVGIDVRMTADRAVETIVRAQGILSRARELGLAMPPVLVAVPPNGHNPPLPA
jgi:hypothetical protein